MQIPTIESIAGSEIVKASRAEINANDAALATAIALRAGVFPSVASENALANLTTATPGDFALVESVDKELYYLKVGPPTDVDNWAKAGSGYEPPDGGIPEGDLSDAVQTAIALASTAVQPSDLISLATLDQAQAKADAAQSAATQAAAADASTKATAAQNNAQSYADAQIQTSLGLVTTKAPVKIVVTTALNVANPGSSSFDGVTLVNGDRVLRAVGTDPANGIHIFNGSGSAMTRSADADAAAELPAGVVIPVQSGSKAGQLWTLKTQGAITLGTTPLLFGQAAGDTSGLVTTGQLQSEVDRATIAEDQIANDLQTLDDAVVKSVNGGVPDNAGSVSVKGTSRGVFTGSTVYFKGDIAVFEGAAYTANADFTSSNNFNGNNWTPLPAVSSPTPGTLIAVENYPPGGNTGFFRKNDQGRIQYRGQKRLFTWNATNAGTLSREGGTGTDQTITLKTSAPISPGADAYVQVSTGTGNSEVHYKITLPTPWDLTDRFLRFPLRVPNNFNDNAVTTNFRLRLSSESTVGSNYVSAAILTPTDSGFTKDGAFYMMSMPVKGNFTATGTGADLSNINSITITAKMQSGVAWYYSIPYFDSVPIAINKAKLVIWLDDGHETHWNTAAKLFAQYGFKGVLAPCISAITNSTEFTPEMLQTMHNFLGFQVATHAYSNAEHTAATSSDQLAQQFQRSRALQSALGVYGGDDFAYWGNQGSGGAGLFSYNRVQQFFRTGRNFSLGERTPETMPPGNPWMMRAYGASTNETFAGDWQPYIQKAIDQRGLAQIVFHAVGTPTGQIAVELAAMLAWLDSNRSLIDVVTIDEAVGEISQNPGSADFGGNTVSNGFAAIQPIADGGTIGTDATLKKLEYNSASAGTAILSASAKKGTTVEVTQIGSGALTFVTASGASLNAPGGLSKTNGPNSTVALWVRSNATGANASWVFAGNGAA